MNINHFFCCIAFASLTFLAGTEIAQSQDVIQLEDGSIIDISEFKYGSDYYCYRVLNEGYVESLNHLCEKEPPPPPTVLSDGRLECRFLGRVGTQTSLGTGATISIPALCIALETVQNGNVRAQLLANSRVIDSHLEVIEYMTPGESYAFDAAFTTDYAPNEGANLTLRFIP